MKKVLLPLLLSVLLVACSSSQKKEEVTPLVDPNDQGRVTAVTPEEPSGSGLDELKNPNSPLYQRSVFFQYDSYIVQSSFNGLVDAHASFLTRNPNLRILLQGNTDDRGSREYNLSLGQKRAEAVKQALMLRGVRETQIEAVSLGKEKPRCQERSESCYAENRRGDILYTGEY